MKEGARDRLGFRRTDATMPNAKVERMRTRNRIR